jgi:hypothetical protein
MKKTKDRECEGECCEPLPEELAVYVEGITCTMRLCPSCAAALNKYPPIPENLKKEFREQYDHYRKTGEVLPTPSDLALKQKIRDLAKSLGVKENL